MNHEIMVRERRLLQFLCDGEGEAQLRSEILARLSSYAFRSTEHQVLFECLCGMPSDRPELIRSLLPARLVRAGFPDFNLEPFFEPHGLRPKEAQKMLELMEAISPGEKETGECESGPRPPLDQEN